MIQTLDSNKFAAFLFVSESFSLELHTIDTLSMFYKQRPFEVTG